MSGIPIIEVLDNQIIDKNWFMELINGETKRMWDLLNGLTKNIDIFPWNLSIDNLVLSGHSFYYNNLNPDKNTSLVDRIVSALDKNILIFTNLCHDNWKWRAIYSMLSVQLDMLLFVAHIYEIYSLKTLENKINSKWNSKLNEFFKNRKDIFNKYWELYGLSR